MFWSKKTFTENFLYIFFLDRTSFSKSDASREGVFGDFFNIYFTTGSMVQKKDIKKLSMTIFLLKKY